MSIYSSGAWLAVRATYLSRHTQCVDCGAKATQPDHVPPRALLLALGIHDPDHERWLQPRCATCHARKTRTVDAPILKQFREGDDIYELIERLERTLHRTFDLGARPELG